MIKPDHGKTVSKMHILAGFANGMMIMYITGLLI
jgi:hypothetical protein